MDEQLLFWREPMFETQAIMNQLEYIYEWPCGAQHDRDKWDYDKRFRRWDDRRIPCEHDECDRCEVEMVVEWCGKADCLSEHHQWGGKYRSFHVERADDVEKELDELLGTWGEAA